ncbi:MAG: symmetrical bis(5'-nucleosyl)-tetraphosphatase [Candidatus Protistobacter heckmanni]|nr:symmetrical bis(5'-nucleosyl)-tetraphosphatase [Candidatus Protistobacter heckmanni]
MTDSPCFVVGDIQGCCTSFEDLAARLPANASFVFVGDLINRGPESLATLRRIISMGERAQAVLGNHDLHCLAVASGIRRPSPTDTLDELLAAPDLSDLQEWLRRRPLAIRQDGFLFAHAGVQPGWSADQVMDLSEEVSARLRGPDYAEFLAQMYGNEPRQWSNNLKGVDRLRVIVNALTRLRFCTPEGVMEFKVKGGPEAAPPGYMPWFDVPGRKTEDVTVVFGHWSTAGLILRPNLIGLDTGCVWGGQLSAVTLDPDPAKRALIQVQCPLAAAPGGD